MVAFFSHACFGSSMILPPTPRGGSAAQTRVRMPGETRPARQTIRWVAEVGADRDPSARHLVLRPQEQASGAEYDLQKENRCQFRRKTGVKGKPVSVHISPRKTGISSHFSGKNDLTAIF